MSWTASLGRPLKPRNHAPLLTLADARAYVLELPPTVAEWNAWQRASKLLLAASKDSSEQSIGAATDQLEVALVVTYRKDMAEM
jgi:hypothetical protein